MTVNNAPKVQQRSEPNPPKRKALGSDTAAQSDGYRLVMNCHHEKKSQTSEKPARATQRQ